jgi:hypothetical protein
MRRLASVEWHTPPPTSVDEQLVAYDDGSALLVVRRPRARVATSGTYAGRPSAEDLRALAAAGPGPIVIDLLVAPPDPATAAVMAVADRVAAGSLPTPRAVATFHVRPLAPPSGGVLAISLLVVADGVTAVEFELDTAASAVHFTSGGQPVAWHPLPDLSTGFVTPDAEGLGGVRRRAHVEPGAFGAIAFDVPVPAAGTAVSVQVAGWLHGSLPDEPTPGRFEVRTAEAALDG